MDKIRIYKKYFHANLNVRKIYIFIGSSVPGALAGKVREAVLNPGGFQCCSHQVYRPQEGGG